MAYTTRDRMIARFSESLIRQLTDDTGIGAINDAVLQVVLDAASGEVDMILQAAGWSVPLADVPEWVRVATETIALRRLYERRQAVPEMVENEYRAALQKLEQIAKQELPVRERGDFTVETDGRPEDVLFRRRR